MSHRRDERGAVAVITAVIMVGLLAVAGLAVDIGTQRVARTDMQSLADVVALDLARELNGRDVATLTPLLATLKQESLGRNRTTLGSLPVLTVELGEIKDDGDFGELTGKAVPSAVRVQAETSVGFVFGLASSGGAVRSAVAQSQGGACFNIGSYAASLDTSKSPLLGQLLGALGSNVNLTAANYEALASADVELAGFLGAKAGVLTLQEVIDGNKLVSLGDFYAATATALGTDNTAAVGVLESLKAEVGDLDLKVPVADLLSLGTGGASGLDATLNALDIVTAGIQAATKDNALALPQTVVNLGPIANVESNAYIIEPPQMGCGRKNQEGARAHSAAARVELHADALKIPAGILNTKVTLDGFVEVAAADGQLTDVRCAPEGITVAVSDGLLDVDLTLEVKIDAIFGLIPAISGPIKITGKSTSSGDAEVNIVDGDYSTPSRVGNNSSGLPVLDVDTSELRDLFNLRIGKLLTGIILDPILEAIINPLIQGLDKVLLTPLLSSLGLDLSGADVFARPTPKCDIPALRG